MKYKPFGNEIEYPEYFKKIFSDFTKNRTHISKNEIWEYCKKTQKIMSNFYRTSNDIKKVHDLVIELSGLTTSGVCDYILYEQDQNVCSALEWFNNFYDNVTTNKKKKSNKKFIHFIKNVKTFKDFYGYRTSDKKNTIDDLKFKILNLFSE